MNSFPSEVSRTLATVKERQSHYTLEQSFVLKFKFKHFYSMYLKTKMTDQLLYTSDRGIMMSPLPSNYSTDTVSLCCSLLSLVRQSQTCCVCLVFDSTGLDSFTGPDYHIPPPASASSSDQLLTGLNCYPIMTAVPAVRHYTLTHTHTLTHTVTHTHTHTHTHIHTHSHTHSQTH